MRCGWFEGWMDGWMDGGCMDGRRMQDIQEELSPKFFLLFFPIFFKYLEMNFAKFKEFFRHFFYNDSVIYSRGLRRIDTCSSLGI